MNFYKNCKFFIIKHKICLFYNNLSINILNSGKNGKCWYHWLYIIIDRYFIKLFNFGFIKIKFVIFKLYIVFIYNVCMYI